MTTTTLQPLGTPALLALLTLWVVAQGQQTITLNGSLLYAEGTPKGSIVTVQTDGAVRLWAASGNGFVQTHNLTVADSVAASTTPCQDMLATVTRNGTVYLHELCSNTDEARLYKQYPSSNRCLNLQTVALQLSQGLDSLVTVSALNVSLLWNLGNSSTYDLQYVNRWATRPQALAVGALNRTAFVVASGQANPEAYAFKYIADNQMSVMAKGAVNDTASQTVTIQTPSGSRVLTLTPGYYQAMQTLSAIDLNCSSSLPRTVNCPIRKKSGGGLSTGGIVAIAVAVPVGVVTALGIAIGLAVGLGVGVGSGVGVGTSTAGAAAVLGTSMPSAFIPTTPASAVVMPSLPAQVAAPVSAQPPVSSIAQPQPQMVQPQPQQPQQLQPQQPQQQPQQQTNQRSQAGPGKAQAHSLAQNISTGASLPSATTIVGAAGSSGGLAALASLAAIPALAAVGATASAESLVGSQPMWQTSLKTIPELEEEEVLTLQLT